MGRGEWIVLTMPWVLDEKSPAAAKLLLCAQVGREAESRGGCLTKRAQSDALCDLEALAAEMRMLTASPDIGLPAAEAVLSTSKSSPGGGNGC